VTTHGRTTRPGVTANLNTATRPDLFRLTAEERETILIRNDADRTWSVHSDSVRKGRVARWLRALGIEPSSLPGGGIEAEGIPEWAVSFRARKRRGRPGPLARSVSSPPQTPIQSHPDGVQGAGGRGNPRTGHDPHGSRIQTGPDGQTALLGIESGGDRPW